VFIYSDKVYKFL